MKAFFLLAFLGLAASVSQLNWVLNQEYAYSVSSNLDARGQYVNSTSRSNGSWSTMTSTLVIKPLQANSTFFYFVMNMFNTQVGVNMNNVSVSSQKSQLSSFKDAEPLGDDMYFLQNVNGQIPEIWYETGDSPYFVNVKLGAINSLQTYIVPAQQQATISEVDPIGTHDSHYQGVELNTQGLTLSRSFSQNTFTSFATDPTLKPGNINLGATSNFVVHPAGHIQTSNFNQLVEVVNIGSTSVSELKKKAAATPNGAVDINFSSFGQLAVSYVGTPETNVFKTNLVFPAAGGNHTKGNFAEVAGTMASSQRQLSMKMENIHQYLQRALESKTMQNSKTIKDLRTVYELMGSQQLSMQKELTPYLIDAHKYPHGHAKIFYILGLCGCPEAQELLVKFGFHAEKKGHILSAVVTANWIPESIWTAFFRAEIKNLIQNTDPEVSNTARLLMNQGKIAFNDSDLPYNKSYGGKINLGGAIVGADLSAEVFAGTNFDCNHPTFNYEAYAEVDFTAWLFGYSQDAFNAKAIYGKVNGSPLADDFVVQVWGKTVYSKQFSTIDCLSHTYDFAHAAPGYSGSYTIWVSIIPITFTYSLDLVLDLSWGYQVCPDQLSANVEVTPSASLVVSGSAEIDLLIIKAGVELDGSFNKAVTPELTLDGSMCELTFDIQEKSSPMSLDFTGYYIWRECKLWIFDCKWGQHHQTTFYSWSEPAIDRTIYQKTWKIAA